ncbi:MAG: hypothetical protein HZC02_04725 [Candidatus Levybacteria bacterium]|nr:hypothetical protein [Candidatus Levybacteria bacterium]
MSRLSELGLLPQPFEKQHDSTASSTREEDHAYIEPLLDITPDFFLERNRTPEVKDNLDEWYEHKQKGELIASILCGDARAWIPEGVARRTASIRALGAGGDDEFKERFEAIMNSKGVSTVAFIGHHDGMLFVPKKAPRGCGITDEHGRQMLSGEEVNGEGYKDFASKHVRHEDPVMQTIYSSQDTLELTDKPVGAFALDHRTGIILPVGYFHHPKQGGYTSETGMNPKYFDKRHYNAPAIYHDGMPKLTEDQAMKMPDNLIEYWLDWEKEMEKVRNEYARNGVDYRQALKVQNPSIISLSTDPRPLGIIYRLGPNTAFKLRVPRASIEDDEFIAPEKLQEVLNQAHYPIDQNTRNFNSPEAAFSNTHTLLIQTRSMEKSEQIAQVAISKPYIMDWLNLPDQRHPHQIIVGQIHQGKVVDMKIFARNEHGQLA